MTAQIPVPLSDRPAAGAAPALPQGDRAVKRGEGHPPCLAPHRWYRPRHLVRAYSSETAASGGEFADLREIEAGTRLLLTNANVTTAAYDKNIELDVLCRGETVARDVQRHFDQLIAVGRLEAAP